LFGARRFGTIGDIELLIRRTPEPSYEAKSQPLGGALALLIRFLISSES